MSGIDALLSLATAAEKVEEPMDEEAKNQEGALGQGVQPQDAADAHGLPEGRHDEM